MLIAVPTEIKPEEYRVAVTPAGVRELLADGHQVVVRAGAGRASDISDEDYRRVGARLTDDVEALWREAGLICKVKEPQPVEIGRLREGQLLFAYLHLAPDEALTRGLLASGASCVAYETVTDDRGRLPLLAPMSAVAGRLSAQVGARLLEGIHGGRGLLMGGVPGVPAARVLVLGAGVVGSNAIRVALGMGADVTVLDVDLDTLAHLDARFGAALTTRHSSRLAVEESLSRADLVIGAALVPGARTPQLVSWSPAPSSTCCRTGRRWSTWRSTRAGASRPATPPPTATRPTGPDTCCTTASPTCPARWRPPPPGRWPTPPSPTWSGWPTAASTAC